MADDMIYTPTYQQVLADAERIARERGDNYVCAEHLLLAYLGDPQFVGNIEMRDRMRTSDPAELAKRIGWFLDSPKPGPGEHSVRPLDGSVTIRRNDDLSTVTRWAPPEVA
ncbi:Clp protease N-terminal domain-containing protein [Nocardia cerradoensis]|nr:Clp protease N-terminal domain-containing protein [Nocardia cerradoensis]